MANTNSDKNNNSNNDGNSGNTNSNGTVITTVVASHLPGIDNSQVIASQPYLIKENSSKIQHKEIKLDKGW
jgi:hypothetical protein